MESQMLEKRRLPLIRIFLHSIFSLFCSYILGQSIQITQVPDYGVHGLLHGTTDGSNVNEFGVVCYVFVQEAGGWWGPKPTFDNPVTPIAPDGSFSIQFITGGYDEYCTRIFVYLKHFSLPPPPFIEGGTLPDDLFDQPYDVVARPHGSRRLYWPDQEHCWIVKESINNISMGPGDNIFSASPENVWIDVDNHLHLKINKMNDLYYSSEIIADTSLGYGKYSFVYNSNPDLLDPLTVFGFFTWDDISPFAPEPEEFFREIDFEFSRWGNPYDTTNAQFVIQPWWPYENLVRYNTGTLQGTIHSFAWYLDSVVFESRKPDSTLIRKWTYTGNYLPKPGKENIRINLWLTNKPPLEQNEIILGDYKFGYHLNAPVNISASDGSGNNSIWIEWDDQGSFYYQVYRSETNNFLQSQPLCINWIPENHFEDTTAEAGSIYYYWLKSADNPSGSNVTGYISGKSIPDSGFISKKHVVSLRDNWNGVSSFISPIDCELDSIFNQISDKFIVLQDLSGTYFPVHGLYTIGTWNPQSGYMIKMITPSVLTFSGIPVIPESLTLNEGWNLMPVLSECEVNVADLFASNNPIIVKEAAGGKLFWPEMGINTIGDLQPGKSYFVKMNNNGNIIFPACY